MAKDEENDDNTTGNRKITVGKKMNLGAVMMAEGIVKKGKRKDGKKKSAMSRVEITPAKNGYMVTSYSDGEFEPKKYVYKNRDAMLHGLGKDLDT